MPTYFSSGGFSSILRILTSWEGMLNGQFRLNETLDIQRFRHIVPYKPFILNFVKKLKTELLLRYFILLQVIINISKEMRRFLC